MSLPVSPISPITPSSPHLAVSREEIARRVAARTRQGRILLPDTEEWVEARREPLRRVVVNIRAKFVGPKAKGVLEVLNTLLSNAVEQCETPEGPKRIRWGSERIKTWIRCDPGGPAEQFLTLAGFSYVLHEHTEYYHIKKWAQLEKRATVKKILGLAHTVLQDNLALIQKSIRTTRNLESREACLEKGRREDALRKIEADRRRVRERCEKEKEERQSAPQNERGGGVVGTRTGTASPPWSSSSASSDGDDDDDDD